MQEHDISLLTVHHSAVPISDARDAPKQVRGHQTFHQQSRGWPDLAYHYVIDPRGFIYQGRDETLRGDTATEYDPAGHFLVCVDGDFNTSTPNDAQIDALVSMLAYGAWAHGVDPSLIAGHRDYASTSCPGDNLYLLVEDGTLRRAVEKRLGEGTPRLELVCGEKGSRLVERIESGDA